MRALSCLAIIYCVKLSLYSAVAVNNRTAVEKNIITINNVIISVRFMGTVFKKSQDEKRALVHILESVPYKN
jgi:hypothetical protein